MLKFVVVLVGVLLGGSLSQAWSEHHRLTQLATASMPELATSKVQVGDFNEVLKYQAYLLQDLKELSGYCQDIEAYSSALSFNENLKINKSYVFKTPAADAFVTAGSILNEFSDEPDWGMDQLLFSTDQYPKLWKPEYAFMGGSDANDPVPTQAFRHMYWEAFSISQASATFKLPTLQPMGEAPDRAAIFIALSKRAKELHLMYWHFRFLANALHYLEDVSQPFHSVQTPTKEFWELPFIDRAHGSGFNGFITQVTHIITYYHFNFEDYVARLLERFAAQPTTAPEAIPFVKALQNSRLALERGSDSSRDIYVKVKKLSALAVGQGGFAGRASVAFFPPLPSGAKFSTFDGEAIIKYMDDSYWTQVFKNGEGNTPEKQAYFKVVQTMFKSLGSFVRTAVKNNE